MNTSEQDRTNAIEWAKAHLGMPGYDEAARHIMNVTGLGGTMEAQVWDHEKHAFTGADTAGGEVVMLDLDPYTRVIVMGTEDHAVESVDPSTLTPNGKRYEIVEVNTGTESKPTTLLPARKNRHLYTVPDRKLEAGTPEALNGAEPGTTVRIDGESKAWTLKEYGMWENGPLLMSPIAMMEKINEAKACGIKVVAEKKANGWSVVTEL